MIDPLRAARAVLLLRDALDLEGAEREAFLARECAGDAALRTEIDALLSRVDTLNHVLDEPALAVAGRLIGDEPDARIGQQIGGFRIDALLGEGGMGSVYRATRSDADFTQTVALKIIRSSAPSAALRERFRRERAILARLDHPGIARFIDGGVTDAGELWFAMALIEGDSIAHHAETSAMGIRERLALLAEVCDAVAAAHRSLIVHRDLKPSNILVDAAGKPHLLDFGIAKLLDDADSSATQTDARAMTPHYAAPEQIRGEAVTTATDVYALGVVLFELLAGRRPFAAASQTPFELQRAVLEASRPSLAEAAATASVGSASSATSRSRDWLLQLRGDLEHIVERAMARDPERRYASAAALADDLRRHLDGRPILARPDTLGYRASKFVQRNQWGVALSALAVLMLLATTAISIVQAQRADRESQRAVAAAALAKSESLRAQAAAEQANQERDAARDEGQRQDALREHFAAVLGRASDSAEAITPARLTELVADRSLLGKSSDRDMQRALDLAIVDFFMVRGDYPRVLTLLEELDADLQDASPRHRALAASNRALAAIRVGKLDLADASISEAEAVMSAEQRRGGAMVSRIEMARGQVQRARGDLPASTASALLSARLAAAATDISEFERGATIGSAAVAMLQLGDLQAAAQLAAQADEVWKVAEVSSNAAMRNVATVGSNALFLRGNLRAAVARMEAINADSSTTEAVPSRAARDLTQAKALALLARSDEALTLLDHAVRNMCDTVGAASLDCLRVRLSAVDTRYLAGQPEQARRELAAMQAPLSAQPPLLAAGNTFAAVLDLVLSPSEPALAKVLEIVPASAKVGALPQRNAVRALLVLTEKLASRGNTEMANRLAQAAIDTAGETIDGDGMDASLLALWRARIAEETAPDAALANLSEAIGESHPWLLAHAKRQSASRLD
jgi:serine/threonine protein kinase